MVLGAASSDMQYVALANKGSQAPLMLSISGATGPYRPAGAPFHAAFISRLIMASNGSRIVTVMGAGGEHCTDF